jgi:hypothetical protein
MSRVIAFFVIFLIVGGLVAGQEKTKVQPAAGDSVKASPAYAELLLRKTSSNPNSNRF